MKIRDSLREAMRNEKLKEKLIKEKYKFQQGMSKYDQKYKIYEDIIKTHENI